MMRWDEERVGAVNEMERLVQKSCLRGTVAGGPKDVHGRQRDPVGWCCRKRPRWTISCDSWLRCPLVHPVQYVARGLVPSASPAQLATPTVTQSPE
jgi:hypothetical protein